MKTLGQLEEAFGADRPAAVARELTKKFEEVKRGTLSELRQNYEQQARVRGEIVLLVGGAD